MLSVCPSGVVNAPVAAVWSFLSEPRRFDLWWDAKVDRVEPEGPMAAGQRIFASTRELGRRFALIFDVEEVTPNRLRLRAQMPFGIVDHVTLTVAPLDERTSRLTFG